MVRVKFYSGLSIAVCYCLLQLIVLQWPSASAKVVVARQTMYDTLSCTSCPIIVGGSNAIYGIRSKILTHDMGLNRTGRTILNMALISEGYSSSNYAAWLAHLHNDPTFIVYSTITLYSLTKSKVSYYGNRKLGGEANRIELFSPERLITKLLGTEATWDFDVHGDLRTYDCSPAIVPADFGAFDEEAADRFFQDVQTLRSIYPKAKMLLRIPPALVQSRQRQDWDHYFSQLASFSRAKGYYGLFLQSMPRLFTSKEYFCDTAFHPNKEYSEKLSHELARHVLMRLSSER